MWASSRTILWKIKSKITSTSFVFMLASTTVFHIQIFFVIGDDRMVRCDEYITPTALTASNAFAVCTADRIDWDKWNVSDASSIYIFHNHESTRTYRDRRAAFTTLSTRPLTNLEICYFQLLMRNRADDQSASRDRLRSDACLENG
jgi:hypothetical protein